MATKKVVVTTTKAGAKGRARAGNLRKGKQPTVAYGFANPRNELKYFIRNIGHPTNTTPPNSGVVTNTPTLNHINIIPLGAGISQREGRQVYNSYVEIRGNIEPFNRSSTATLARQAVRLLVFVDKNTNGVATAPAASDIFDADSAVWTPSTASWVYASFNINFRKRFKILVDKTMKMGAGGTNGQYGDHQHAIKLKVPLNFKTQYTDTAGASDPSAIASGCIWVLWVSDDAAANDTPMCSLSCRLRYHE